MQTAYSPINILPAPVNRRSQTSGLEGEKLSEETACVNDDTLAGRISAGPFDAAEELTEHLNA